MTLARRLTAALAFAGILALAAAPGSAPPAEAQTTLRAVLHSDLKIVDPIRTTAYIVRNYGYMDILNPVMAGFLNSACDKVMFGWPCDEQMEKLRDQFARETDPAKQKALAEAVQVRLTQHSTHVPLGQWYQPIAVRKNVDGVITAPVPVFWKVEVKK